MNQVELGLIINTHISNIEKALYLFDSIYIYRYMAIFGDSYGIKVGLFAMDDLRMKDGRPFGPALVWHHGSFSTVSTHLPEHLETAFFMSKGSMKRYPEDVAAWLLNKHLSKEFYNKKQLSSVLLRYSLGEYTIPTIPVSSYQQIVDTVHMWNRCVLKPINGKRGNNVWFLDCKDNIIHFEGFDSVGIMTEEIWKQWLSDYPHYSTYVVQPRLDFHNSDNHAIDFRALVSLGGSGKWELIALYSRIGKGHVVSNVSAKGSIADGKDLLVSEFNDTDHSLYDRICRLALSVSEAVTDSLQGQGDTFYGIDIGIDRKTKQLYIIEVNPFPGTKFHTQLLAEKRVQYYKYLLQKD